MESPLPALVVRFLVAVHVAASVHVVVASADRQLRIRGAGGGEGRGGFRSVAAAVVVVAVVAVVVVSAEVAEAEGGARDGLAPVRGESESRAVSAFLHVDGSCGWRCSALPRNGRSKRLPTPSRHFS